MNSPAMHKLVVTPGRDRLIVSCVVCEIIDFEPTAFTVRAFSDLEEAHQLEVARKIIEPNVYP